MTCKNCGSENQDGKFCMSCGAKMEQESIVVEAEPVVPPVQPAQPVYSQPVYQTINTAPTIPDKYRPLSPWAYFGYQLLFSIPIAGFILLIVFACGGCSNLNLRNFARSYFCGLLIVAILLAIVFVVAIAGGMLPSMVGGRY